MKNKEAIEQLDRRIDEIERKANVLLEAVNELRAEDGLPPRPPFGSGSSSISGGTSAVSLSQIKPDTFYGKKLQTAVREYLDMRRAQGTGPATPREIYEAIVLGGFQFDAKSPDIAMVGLRALLRKRTAFFHKLPNGNYGLTSWYPDAKKAKHAADDGDDDAEEAPAEKTDTANEPKLVRRI